MSLAAMMDTSENYIEDQQSLLEPSFYFRPSQALGVQGLLKHGDYETLKRLLALRCAASKGSQAS